LFEKYKVLNGTELHSRYEVYLEQYAKNINIEAQASIQMVKKQYVPAVIGAAGQLAKDINEVKSAGGNVDVQKDLLKKISSHLEAAYEKLAALEAATKKAQGESEAKHKAESFRDKVVPAMNSLRSEIDALEMLCPSDRWPVPSYTEMLFKL
jgi:glutamine synthetase